MAVGGDERWVPQLRELAEPLVKDNFLELFDLTVRRQGAVYNVSLVLDRKDRGITLEDCTTVSRELEKRLDELDLVPGAYVLEVSSPGLDRPLRSLEDCGRFAGRKAHLVTREAVGNQVSFEGRLEGVEGGAVRLRLGESRTVDVPWDKVKKANLVVEL
jgi:ribosome maturation factor RimP